MISTPDGRLTIAPRPTSSTVTYDGRRAHLNPTETQILSALKAAHPQAIPIGDLCVAVWDEDSYYRRIGFHVYLSSINRKIPGLISGAYGFQVYYLNLGQGEAFTHALGGLQVDAHRGYCKLHGKRINLTSAETRALLALIAAYAVYPGYMTTGVLRASRIYPHVLRRKLGKSSIAYVTGVGYRLEVGES